MKDKLLDKAAAAVLAAIVVTTLVGMVLGVAAFVSLAMR